MMLSMVSANFVVPDVADCANNTGCGATRVKQRRVQSRLRLEYTKLLYSTEQATKPGIGYRVGKTVSRTMDEMDFSAARQQFPSLAHWTYLNTATYGQMPKRAVEAANRHFARRDEFACTDFIAWFEDMDQIRGLCARLINCHAEDIAFVTSSSSGLSWLMQGIDWRHGDEILTLDPEFPNQLYQVALEERFGIR